MFAMEDVEDINLENENREDLQLSFFIELPEELIVKILSYLSPYTDIKNAKLVNRQWNRMLTANEMHCKRLYKDGIRNCNIMWTIHKQHSYDITETLLPGRQGRSTFRKKVRRANVNVPSPRFSHAAVLLGQYMYVFCGSSSESNTSSTFNDLFKLDLSTHTWQKLSPEGLLPAPRECCTMVGVKQKPGRHLYQTIPYKGKLIVFGGWCQPSVERIIIGPRFFDDTQIFHVNECKWQRINVDDNYPTARAGHSASMVGNKMVIFGGSQRNNRLNDVWIFDTDALSWTCPYIRSQKPKERFGQSQFTINDHSVMILGGCGGPHELFGDVWLFDVIKFQWTKLRVENQLHEPPDLWCHASVLVNGDIAVFSKEKKCPYCECPIQHFKIPTETPIEGSCTCACGRRNPEDRIHLTQPRLQMYLLDCGEISTNSCCKWTSYKYLTPAPPARRLFSAMVGINEILIFGGLQDGLTQESQVDDLTILVSAKPP